MTSTDELRRLLDERGVEWGAEESELDHVTTWNANGGQAMFYESKTTIPNLLQVNYHHLTPEQAIEATLGRSGCVYVLTAIDPGDGREYTLGIYATKELAEKSAETDGRGYVLHDVSRWEVVDV